MDEIDLALLHRDLAIVVLRLHVRAEPRDAQHELARGERFIFDLPDREVWIASTRSSTTRMHDAQIDATEGEERDEEAGTHAVA